MFSMFWCYINTSVKLCVHVTHSLSQLHITPVRHLTNPLRLAATSTLMVSTSLSVLAEIYFSHKVHFILVLKEN